MSRNQPCRAVLAGLVALAGGGSALAEPPETGPLSYARAAAAPAPLEIWVQGLKADAERPALAERSARRDWRRGRGVAPGLLFLPEASAAGLRRQGASLLRAEIGYWGLAGAGLRPVDSFTR